MMIRKKIRTILGVMFVLCLVLSNEVSAALLTEDAGIEAYETLTDASSEAGYDTTQLVEDGVPAIIAKVVKAFLSLLGIIFVFLMLIAGYNWMTAAGDESKVTKAKETISRATIGLIIIVLAYSITHFVFKALD